MNKTLFNICVAALIAAPAATALPVDVKQTGQAVERSENTLYINTDIDVSGFKRGSNREVWIHPVIVNGNDSVSLPGVIVAGRNRYYQALRHDIPQKEGVALYRSSESLTSVPYQAQVPYQEWMNGSVLLLHVDHKGCCGDDLDEAVTVPLTSIEFAPRKFVPAFNWVTPTAEKVKHRELKGSAFIDFPVNKIVIYPEYRRNTVELAKIRATIDSVHQDKDITITALSIKGFASPEGPWDNNVRLAKGRTAALKTYVEKLYNFAPDFITTSYDPEDWGGLRAYVENSNIANRDGILALIDSSLEPDAKDHKIKATYPDQYAFLLAEVYPALRHSDYKIDYTIKSYTDVNEILRLVKTRPQNLSLQEFFLAAKAVEQGSYEYNEIFETAVRMYPESDVANLNAANVAMSRGDYALAEKYLSRCDADDSRAIYGRGILAALQGKYSAARELFERAAKLRVADAPAAIEQIDRLMK